MRGFRKAGMLGVIPPVFDYGMLTRTLRNKGTITTLFEGMFCRRQVPGEVSECSQP